MGANTKIEWAHHTFNPWRGCSPVSEGCRNCYAARLGLRFADGTAEMRGGRPVYTGTLIRTSERNWRIPLAWNADALRLGQRHRVFCASLADWLDDAAPSRWLADLLTLIEETPNLDWLLLTKRPENFESRIAAASEHLEEQGNIASCWISGRDVPSNVWIGTTVENQNAADERIPHLLSIPARVRFLSCEPLLGRVEIEDHIGDQLDGGYVLGSSPIQWVICGGESGPHARPMHPYWARSLRDQCIEAGTLYLFKQWGEWCPVGPLFSHKNTEDHENAVYLASGLGGDFRVVAHDGSDWTNEKAQPPPSAHVFVRTGKSVAGRRLDGELWDRVPS